MKKSQFFSLSEQSNRKFPQVKSKKPSKGKTVPLPFEVIIMAGGKGERLKPLTKDVPKPLLDVGGKPIVEYMISRLAKLGVKYFTFCLNHMGERVEEYFGDGKDRGIEISYIYETEPLGTIGGISLKKEFHFEDILVVNGDLLTTINFEKFYSHFLANDADLSVATIPYRINLPYGILDLDDNFHVSGVKEKPTFTYHLNTGIYLLRKEMIDIVPSGKRFDAIELIEAAIAKQSNVSSYPLLEYWIDIGQMEDYEKAQKDIQYLEL